MGYSPVKPVILVVDDEFPIRELLIMDLEDHYQLLEADNGRNALEIVKTTPELSVMLTDLSMPLMTGIELLRSVRELRPHLPVVVLTAFDDRQRILDALRSGAYDFITKPFQRDIVASAVKRAVEHHAYLQLLQHQQELHAALAVAMCAAHEINNPLTLIKGVMEYHLTQSALSEELRADLMRVNTTVDTMAEQVRRLGQIRQVSIDNRFGFPLLDLAQALAPDEPDIPNERTLP